MRHNEKNIVHYNLKNGISLITLIITVIVIIILAAIVLFTGLNAPDSAKFAKYTQQVDNFQTAIQEEYMQKKIKNSINNQSRTDEQVYYTIATGNEVDVNTKTETIRTGTIAELEESGIIVKPTALEGTEYYEVAQGMNIAGNKDTKGLYDKLGTKEHHYITDKGEFFVLPGYRYEGNDGSTKWYVTAGKYYESDEPIQVVSEPVEELNIGDVITNYSSNTALPQGTNWIYFGTDSQGHKLLTTSQPISNACTINSTAEGWLNLEESLNDACSLYIGEGAIKARSITLADISRVTGFSEVESSAYTTYFFKDGDNDPEHNQYNLCYPSKNSPEYWKSPTSTPEPFVTPNYSYSADWHGTRCEILGVEHINDEITDCIDVENLIYVVGEYSNLDYAVATPSLWVRDYGGDIYQAWYSYAFVGYGTVYTDGNAVVTGDLDAIHDWTWNGTSATYTESVRPIIELPSSFVLEKE